MAQRSAAIRGLQTVTNEMRAERQTSAVEMRAQFLEAKARAVTEHREQFLEEQRQHIASVHEQRRAMKAARDDVLKSNLDETSHMLHTQLRHMVEAAHQEKDQLEGRRQAIHAQKYEGERARTSARQTLHASRSRGVQEMKGQQRLGKRACGLYMSLSYPRACMPASCMCISILSLPPLQ